MTFRKDDECKPRFTLLPHDALAEIIDVLEHGAAKYGADNWKLEGADYQRYYDAAQRHLMAWWLGTDQDSGSGQHHLAHAACCIIYLLTYHKRGLGLDNRDKCASTSL